MKFSGIQTLTVCFIGEAGESLSLASTGEERHTRPGIFAHSSDICVSIPRGSSWEAGFGPAPTTIMPAARTPPSGLCKHSRILSASSICNTQHSLLTQAPLQRNQPHLSYFHSAGRPSHMADSKKKYSSGSALCFIPWDW